MSKNLLQKPVLKDVKKNRLPGAKADSRRKDG